MKKPDESVIVIWVMLTSALMASLVEPDPDVLWIAARALGIVVLLSLAVPLVKILYLPERIAHPMTIFSIGCLYFLVLDMATFREVEDYPPQIVLVADLVITLFVAMVFTGWALSRVSARRWCTVLAGIDGHLSASTYFWLAVVGFGLEYLRRLYLDGFSFSELTWDLSLARAGGGFRRGNLGDSTVWMQPVEVLFWLVPLFAERAWKHGVGTLAKVIVVPLVIVCLGTLVLDGTRGYLLFAIFLPLLVRAVERERTVSRDLAFMVLASFVLAPVLDSMYQVRGAGWNYLWRVDRISWNMASAERDDNFRAVVNLVNILEQGDGILEHRGPLGFISGSLKFGGLALISPIPRALWASKPSPFDLVGEGRGWWESGSIVADLLDGGGITFVVFGGWCFGLWIRFLESLYEVKKEDGAALVYSMLLAVTLSILRGLYPWNTVPLVLSTVGLVMVCRVLRSLALASPSAMSTSF